MFGGGPCFPLASTLRRAVAAGRRGPARPWAHRTYFTTTKYSTELQAHVARAEGIPMYRILDEQGKVINAKDVPVLGKSVSRRMLQQMISVNMMDHLLYEAQRQGRISFYMTTAGEEATHVGSAAALAEDDPIYGQYREVGSLLWRGFPIADVMNQCYSNHLDAGKGRQMPVHYGSAKHQFQTISSPLGTQIPQAAGAAYALRVQGLQNVVMCYFGDGAASEGDFHAGLNIAATTRCPVLFFCRNNHYAISTHVEEQYRGDGIAARGPGYGIPAYRVDGNDILAVYKVTEVARRQALETGSPIIIEAITYRLGHHSTSDDSLAYRGKEDIEKWLNQNSPIVRLKNHLISQGHWSEQEDAQFREETRKMLLAEFAAAEKRPKPAISEMFTDVYDELPWSLREQQGELREILREHPQRYPLSSYLNSEEFLKK